MPLNVVLPWAAQAAENDCNTLFAACCPCRYMQTICYIGEQRGTIPACPTRLIRLLAQEQCELEN
eukprot:1138503-Pelagomonas_calceolata.AAC.4